MPHRYADPIPWRQVTDDQRRSGLTQAEFCRRLGLSLHAFRKHLYTPSPAPEATPAAPGPADRPRLVPVTLVTDPILKIKPNGIEVEGGGEYPVDIIVYATGFKANDFLWPMEVRGRGCGSLRLAHAARGGAGPRR